MDETAIQKIKDHMFYEEHLFDDGTVRKFDPDYWQAESWENLESGNMDKMDKLLLEHELYESDYMKQYNCTYEKAHREATKVSDWRSNKFIE